MFKKMPLVLCLLFFVLPVIAQTTFKTPEELARPNGAFADIDGVRVYYETEGDPANPPVVLIHGFGGSTFTWRDTLPALASAGFYAIAVDLPPFGLSDKTPTLSYSRSWMADVVAGLLDELNIPQAVIVGHSMGGAVTAQFAVRHPEKVQKLVFVAGGVFEAIITEDSNTRGATGVFSAINAIDPTAPAAPLLLRALITRDFFVNSIKSAYFNPDQVTEEVADGYAQLLLIEDAPIGFLAYAQAQEDSPITLDDLAQAVSVPTLIVWGENDTWVNIRLGETMRAKLADVTWVTYENVGHLPMEEDVTAFNADLIAFLSE
jgi:pimeloyl-ACP methyl ester carboxylesterase